MIFSSGCKNKRLQCYDWWKKLYQPVKNNSRKHDNIWKNCNRLGRWLHKQQALDADPKAIQQIYFKGNLERDENENIAMLFIIEEAKETALDFLQGTVKVFWFHSLF